MYVNIKLCQIHSWLTNSMQQISSLEATCPYPKQGNSSPWAHINIIFTWTTRSAKWFLSLNFSTKTFARFSPQTFNMLRPFHTFLFYYPNDIWWGVRPWNFSMYNFLQSHLPRFSQTHVPSSAIFSRKTYFFLKVSNKCTHQCKTKTTIIRG